MARIEARSTVRYGVEVQFFKSRGDLHADGAGLGPTRSRRSAAANASCTTTSVSAPALRLRSETRRTSRCKGGMRPARSLTALAGTR